mmetsp:Transcript_15063/g.32719  ORF Transcript_15063/g.32719 Transcript_15063/m.32719 type:complete len:205 (-) Transcript_15063:32-646(-)
MPLLPRDCAATAMEDGEHMPQMTPMPHMMMMQMYFTTSLDVIILWKEWHVKSWGPYLGSCIGIIFCCLFHELVVSYREKYVSDWQKKRRKDSRAYSSSSSFLDKILDPTHLIVTLMYAFSVTWGYLIMLVVMTYNVGLFVSVIVGLTLGHFLFRSKAGHVSTTDVCCPETREPNSRGVSRDFGGLGDPLLGSDSSSGEERKLGL